LFYGKVIEMEKKDVLTIMGLLSIRCIDDYGCDESSKREAKRLYKLLKKELEVIEMKTMVEIENRLNELIRIEKSSMFDIEGFKLRNQIEILKWVVE